MIQRVQTLYLVVAAVLSGIAYGAPFLAAPAGATEAILQDGFLSVSENGLLTVGCFVAMLCFGAAIFMFKRRKQQMLWVLLGASVAFGLVVLGGYHMAAQGFGWAWGFLLPLVSVVLAFLARTRIAADEKLVRSSESLR